jgi:hypothetical protein
MNRRQKWAALAALGLALAAGTARAQTGNGSSYVDDWVRYGWHISTPAWTWEFSTTREDGEARLQVQIGLGARATCEGLTLRMAGTPVTLTADGQKVRVRGGAGERGGLRIEASADRVNCDATDVLTLEGRVQARYDRKGQAAQIIKGEKVTLDLRAGSMHIEGAGSAENTGPAPISLDTGFPIVKPADQTQVFNFWQGFFR